ncbi:DUF6263 family protein [Clostridium brassicae]|uniref:DUF6263 family protein n=1 Tax=Clostridium brassicae TaxID=2999072 RepID=A0ABT4DHF9_9CLOT|nr:DUF6263 family protein [Clostridium brassicae]MCY6960541.1 DUF6263 family protein [Clostridium brassicae]
MKKKIVDITCLTLISILIFSGCMEKKVKLTLNLKKGDSYKIDMVTEEKVIENISDKKVEVNSKYNTSYSCYINNIDKSKNASIQVTFDSLTVKSVENNGQTLEYNSGNPNSNKGQLSKIYSVLPGKNFTVKIGGDGKVKEVIGIDELIGKVLKELEIKDEKQKQELQKIIVDNFGEEAVKKQVENITSVYPDEAVKTGDVWENKSEVLGQYPLEAENKYTLKENKDGIAEITVESKISTKKGKEPLILEPIKLSYEIQGTQNGLLNIDEKSGIPKHVKINYKYAGDIKFTSQDANIGSRKFPVNIEGNTIINIAGK